MGTYLPKQTDQEIVKEKTSNTDEANFVWEMFSITVFNTVIFSLEHQFARKTGALTKKKMREAGETQRVMKLFPAAARLCDLQ